MKIFLDTADIEEIRIAARWGVLDGVTTNPTLYAKVGGSYDDILSEICDLRPARSAPRSSPRTSTACSREGRAFAKLAPNIVVKVPMSEEGLEAIARFADEGHQDQLHADLHGQPGPARGQGRRVAAVAVRRPPRRHQPGRHGSSSASWSPIVDIARPRRRGARRVDPSPPPRDQTRRWPAPTSRRCRSRSSSRWSTTRSPTRAS